MKFFPAATSILYACSGAREACQNPTYFVTRGDWRAVLRKQPNNVLMPSGSMRSTREYRVLKALQGAASADAEARSLLRGPRRHRDAVLSDGMARRPRLPRVSTPGLRPDERRELFRSMCAALAAIHKLELPCAGVERFRQAGQLFRATAQPLVQPMGAVPA